MTMQTDRPAARPLSGLSAKLMTTIVVVILLVEIAIYLPSVANFRASWLDDRLRVGVVAARVLDAVPDVMALPRTLTDRLLNSAGATAIVYRREGQSQLIELADAPVPREAVTADMRQRDPLTLIGGALDTLLFGGERTLRIVGENVEGAEVSQVEVLMPEAPLRAELLIYSRNILILSLIVALMTAIVLYVFVSVIFISPVRRLTNNMIAFRQAPENASLIISPQARRRDEIGVMEQELAAMETDLFSMLRQRRHLADLGLAVAKINHDLRNTLTSAQLLSDQVATLDDPKVQRLAPRLVLSIDKAIGFAQSVLDYGRQSVAPPRLAPLPLRTLIEDAAFDAGLVGHPGIAFSNGVPDTTTISADPDQAARIFLNLLKNAREAMEAAAGRVEAPRVSVDFALEGNMAVIGVVDNGPGLPPRARENLFVAFEGSARAGGTGLGLAIARELAEGHGGKLAYIPLEPGTRFEVSLPQPA
ncbi:HAMP domain-containing histidine kinase [Arsenicitalea aurantiaca]|uniref:histidine kinase n=1 Tax=Arsenicitalea aurantiaca TaxID=1783274 RepID=A0A433X2A4_9HYPH|nr:HAMP domain-containing sensor histidine kinase [Arsenicitalea aurantiaca]RUT28233.1 HAMP domain-containing histidine kinase [Arsenicitalea aurantiaca]